MREQRVKYISGTWGKHEGNTMKCYTEGNSARGGGPRIILKIEVIPIKVHYALYFNSTGVYFFEKALYVETRKLRTFIHMIVSADTFCRHDAV